MRLVIHTDGGARGNPGPAAIGVLIEDETGKKIFAKGKAIGRATNNVAEYTAVLEALKESKKLGATELDFFLDSELVVKQLNGEYKVRHIDLAALYLKIHNLRANFKKITFKHIYREKNKEADRLLNQALDAI